MIPQKELDANRINPAYFSEVECEFLLKHLGEPPVVALREAVGGINPRAVEPLLRRVTELEEMKKHRGEDWVGIDALRGAISTYLTQMRRWRSDRRKGAPRFPSMFAYSPKGRPIANAPGADNGIVKTYFDDKGERKTFVIELIEDDVQQWHPEWSKTDEPAAQYGIAVNQELLRVECFCGHTEKFKSESRASYSAARARMSKHLRHTTEDVERHREVYALEYGS